MARARTDGLEDALRARGLRATPQRRLVLDALGDLGHGTPEQVGERVQEVAPSLSLSTVYRTLELLEDLGVVSHTHLGHGAPSYHLASHDDHIHLVCRRCGVVQEADVARARRLAEEVAARYGFVTDVGHLSLDGLCRACARAVERERAATAGGGEHGATAGVGEHGAGGQGGGDAPAHAGGPTGKHQGV